MKIIGQTIEKLITTPELKEMLFTSQLTDCVMSTYNCSNYI